ncbi:YIP1 family protein [Hazenella coriacea]|uniref:Yip1-like protein n=1 Tax=Hazenella coriacea TaxID=1179467 RepID=A0A4R3L7K8_9BACL|nr:YIP1 family protein [Hazenella coriacea]TCS95753.1 Yip1-like protein [Hazenella coriacea]
MSLETIVAVFRQPREEMHSLFYSDSRKQRYLIISLFGLALSFDIAVGLHLGDQLDLWTILGICLVIGPLLGILYSFILSGFIHLCSKIFGGQADWDQSQKIIVYSSLIYSLKNLVVLVKLLFFREETFASTTYIANSGILFTTMFIFLLLMEVLLLIYYYVTLVVFVSESNDLSIAISLLTVVLVMLLITLPFVLFNLLT